MIISSLVVVVVVVAVAVIVIIISLPVQAAGLPGITKHDALKVNLTDKQTMAATPTPTTTTTTTTATNESRTVLHCCLLACVSWWPTLADVLCLCKNRK